MNLWKSIAGMTQVQLTSADLSQSFEAIREKNIVIFQVKTISDLTARFTVYQKDYRTLEQLFRKRGETLEITARKGVYWNIRTLLHRPIFCIGLVGLILLSAMVPRYVFFVEVEGNILVPDKLILEAAEDCGIYFGASRWAVRSEHVKNGLLSRVPELQWAGVNTQGCVAVISVRERTETVEEPDAHRVSSIIADRDGVIISCTATKGNLVCTQGQAVRAGELLVSGFTDCGLTIQASEAQGEIFAQTIREITAVSPLNWSYYGPQQENNHRVSLLLGKKRIILWKDSGIWDATCGRMYKEYYITLPGDFQLPIALCIDSYGIREPVSEMPEADETDLQEFAKEYLLRQMIAGVILEAEESITKSENCCVLKGRYVCTEMIGRIRPEKMGEEDG